MKTFRDQPIIRKTRILTVAVIIIFALALVLTFGTYWLLGARRTVEAAAVENARNAATTLDRTLRTITESFVSAFGTENFSAELFEMQVPGSDSIHNRIRVQNELMALSSCSPFYADDQHSDRRDIFALPRFTYPIPFTGNHKSRKQ